MGDPTHDFTKIGVDELFSLEVTSVDGNAQKLSKAPAAAYVLTPGDIPRRGAGPIAAMLRVLVADDNPDGDLRPAAAAGLSVTLATMNEKPARASGMKSSILS